MRNLYQQLLMFLECYLILTDVRPPHSLFHKPPRPPNAFILYRRAKKPGILTRHQGITNNEVSKEIGRM
ncbi:hypothetical protein RhiirC2_808382 [Rhizophagus irregularis]|uniref:HMG box domain-containing protein n=1 Tax=Rhizophagus irregularis TaxID=588596 RepID=A0A2N1NUW0_9GLOM|nr:hypothetical protein RhiirC2_808382 [Rhizophagus irregularis]